MRTVLFLIPPATLGAFFFVFVLGGYSVLDVSNIGWLSNGDPAQHFIGWNFFRNTPLLQWPLGLNYPYGMEISNSIVYTDSIPIVALFFKIFNTILPLNFQYTGLWLLLCLIMQSVVAFYLIYKKTNNYFFSCISSVLFCLSPVLFERLTGHFALSAHFLLLTAIYFYIHEKRISSWVLLICFSSLIHFYITGMILIIYLASLINNIDCIYGTKRKSITIVMGIISVLIPLYLVMYSIGYFTVKSGVSGEGFGQFKTNLNSFFNPLFDYGSYFLPRLSHSTGDYEGYSYLGLGIILLYLLSSIAFIVNKSYKNITKKDKVTLLLFIVILLFSLSNSIYFGDKEVAHIPIPECMHNILSIFRSSGRFIWVFYYFLLYLSLISIYRLLPSRLSCVVILFFTFIQYIDLSNSITHIKNRYKTNDDISKGLDTIKVSNILSSYKSLQVILPSYFWDRWSEFGYIASKNNISINFGYMARVDEYKKEKQLEHLYNSIDSGQLDNQSVYVFMDSGSLKYVTDRIKIDYTINEISGYYFLQPKISH